MARRIALVRIGLAVALLTWAPGAFSFVTPFAIAGWILPAVWLAAGVALLIAASVRPTAGVLAVLIAVGLSPLPQKPVVRVAVSTALVLVALAGSSSALRPPRSSPTLSSATAIAGRALQLLVTLAWLTLAVGVLRTLRTDGLLLPALAGPVGCLFVAVGLWIPAVRPWAYLVSVVTWVGTDALGSFGLSPALAATLPWSGVLFLDAGERSRLVVWDDRCSLCRPRVALLRRLDWLCVHRFEGASNRSALKEIGLTQDDVNREMRLRANGRVLGGFDALLGVLRSLPVSFLWAPIWSVPPLHTAGARAYRYIAGHW